MKKKLISLNLCLFYLILIINTVNAANINFGSVTDTTYLELKPGETGYFKILFFNLGEEPIYLKLNVENPDPRNLGVDVLPDITIKLDPVKPIPDPKPSPGSEWLILDKNKYVKATPIKVKARLPSDPNEISRSEYKIRLTAIAGESKTQGEGIKQNVAQAREFTLILKVLANIPQRTQAEPNLNENPSVPGVSVSIKNPEKGQEENIHIEKNNFIGPNEITGLVTRNPALTINIIVVIIIISGIVIIAKIIRK